MPPRIDPMQDIDAQAAASAKVIIGDTDGVYGLSSDEAKKAFDKNSDGRITDLELGGLNGLVGDKKTVMVDGQNKTVTTVGGVVVESQAEMDMARLTSDYKKLKASSNPKDQQKAKNLDAFFAMTPAELKHFEETVQIAQALKLKGGKTLTSDIDGDSDAEWKAAMALTGKARDEAVKNSKGVTAFVPPQRYEGILTAAEKNEIQREADSYRVGDKNTGGSSSVPRGVDLPGQIPTAGPTPTKTVSPGAGGPRNTTTPSAKDMGMGGNRVVEKKEGTPTPKINDPTRAPQAGDGGPGVLSSNNMGIGGNRVVDQVDGTPTPSQAQKDAATKAAAYGLSMKTQNDALIAADDQKTKDAAFAKAMDNKDVSLAKAQADKDAAAKAAAYATSMKVQNDALIAAQDQVIKDQTFAKAMDNAPKKPNAAPGGAYGSGAPGSTTSPSLIPPATKIEPLKRPGVIVKTKYM